MTGDANKAITSWKIDTKSERSLNNWHEKLDLTCVPEFKAASMMAAFFIGWAIALLFLPRLADIYGRKGIFLTATSMQVTLMTVGLMTTSLNLMIAVFFGLGVATSVRMAVGYNYLIEFAPVS